MNVTTEIVYPSPGYSFCFQVTKDRKLHFNWHRHAEYEFSVCRSGIGEVHIGEMIYSFREPAAFLISPNADHALASKENFDGWIIQIPPLILSHYESRPEFHFLAGLISRTTPALRFSEGISGKIVQALEKAQDQSGVFRWIGLLEAFYIAAEDQDAQLCSIRQEQPEKCGEGQEDKLAEILNFLFTRSTDTHNLGDLARSAGMPVQSFCRQFKKRTGMTFVEYLHSVRINAAKKLLQQSKMYVDDICYETGFNSISFFNRKFREHTGMTPREYRQRFGTDCH